MDMLKMTVVVVALLALAGCIVEPIGGGPGYYGDNHRAAGFSNDNGGWDRGGDHQR